MYCNCSFCALFREWFVNSGGCTMFYCLHIFSSNCWVIELLILNKAKLEMSTVSDLFPWCPLIPVLILLSTTFCKLISSVHNWGQSRRVSTANIDWPLRVSDQSCQDDGHTQLTSANIPNEMGTLLDPVDQQWSFLSETKVGKVCYCWFLLLNFFFFFFRIWSQSVS